MPKILLVDDEEIERRILHSFIQEGFPEITEIGEAENGAIAVEMFNKIKYDMIIMDIKMPGMTGIEAAKYIKNIKPDVIVVFLSAYVEAGKIHQAYTSGGQEYLQKPIRKADFIGIIAKYWEKKDSGLITLKNSLNESIVKSKYTSSKEFLDEVIVYINAKNKNENIVKVKEDYKEIIESIGETVFSLNAKFSVYKLEFQRMIEKANPIADIYLLKCWAFEALDFAFIIMESEKSETLQYEEITKALNYIERNYKNNVTLEEVAEHVNMSPSYLSKQFKRDLGINFIDYVTDLKIKTAKEMLANTNKPVRDISIELSYNESNYFTRVFRKITGMTPMEYRESEKQNKDKNYR